MTDTSTAIARISRISFLTDMTRADAPVIPLGYMFEGVWPKKARWLGLIGRLRLTPPELERVNLATWSELKTPFVVLMGLFTKGWAAPWGEAGNAVQTDWQRGALSIHVEDRSALIADKQIDSEGAWANANNFLLAELVAFQSKLVPIIKAPVVEMPRPKLPPVPAVATRPVIPTGSQIMTDVPDAESRAAA